MNVLKNALSPTKSDVDNINVLKNELSLTKSDVDNMNVLKDALRERTTWNLAFKDMH